MLFLYRAQNIFAAQLFSFLPDTTTLLHTAVTHYYSWHSGLNCDRTTIRCPYCQYTAPDQFVCPLNSISVPPQSFHPERDANCPAGVLVLVERRWRRSPCGSCFREERSQPCAHREPSRCGLSTSREPYWACSRPPTPVGSESLWKRWGPSQQVLIFKKQNKNKTIIIKQDFEALLHCCVFIKWL